jgi:hypothetical protein
MEEFRQYFFKERRIDDHSKPENLCFSWTPILLLCILTIVFTNPDPTPINVEGEVEAISRWVWVGDL